MAMKQLSKEKQLVEYVIKNAEKGNPNSVLNEMENYSKSFKRLMHIGETKGELMKKYINQEKIKVGVELGAYCGFSAIWSAMNISPSGKLYSFEINPEFVQNTNKMVEWAGLSKKVEVIEGTIQTRINYLKDDLKVNTVDYLLIDHLEKLYITDLVFMEKNNLLVKDSVVIADNILHPGAPDYQQFMEQNKNYTSTLETMEKSIGSGKTVTDGILASIRL